MKRLFVFATLFLCVQSIICQPGSVQITDAPDPFILGEVRTIKSAEMGESRTLNIYLPEGYSPDSARTYPVIYLLDGSANEDFIHITGIVQFLNMIGQMPPCIVVGIVNVDRKRDFTFPTTIEQDKIDFPTTGGSARFIAFLDHEVKPFIESQYKTNGDNAIIGQSLGGLLATEILFSHCAMFNRYLIVSPSLWWDNESLIQSMSGIQCTAGDRPLQVYISVGNEGERMVNDADKLNEILQAATIPEADIFLNLMPEENHLTILHNSIYSGFLKLFDQK